MDTVVDCYMGSYSTGVITNADCIILLAQLTQACKSPLVIVVNVYDSYATQFDMLFNVSTALAVQKYNSILKEGLLMLYIRTF